MYDSINTMLNANADTEDSDDEFTLKDVVDKNVGSILDAATSADDEDDDDEVNFLIFIFWREISNISCITLHRKNICFCKKVGRTLHFMQDS